MKTLIIKDVDIYNLRSPGYQYRYTREDPVCGLPLLKADPKFEEEMIPLQIFRDRSGNEAKYGISRRAEEKLKFIFEVHEDRVSMLRSTVDAQLTKIKSLTFLENQQAQQFDRLLQKVDTTTKSFWKRLVFLITGELADYKEQNDDI